MKERYYSTIEIAQMTGADEGSLLGYEEEGLIVPRLEGGERYYTDEDVERIGMIRRLTEDLGVNLPGVAVVLHMREQMVDMQRQFERLMENMKAGMLKELNEYEARLRRPRIERKAGKRVKIVTGD